MIREDVDKSVIIADGAMGTYYSQLTGEYSGFPEKANITNPALIKEIHSEYIRAGARLIRTNTFSANTVTLGMSAGEIEELVARAYEIAVDASKGSNVYIAANIGPIPEIRDGKIDGDRIRIINEYKLIADTFIKKGAEVFTFETFSSLEYLDEITAYIKEKKSSAFVLVQFATTVEGYTRKGISIKRLVQSVRKIKSIDAYGFNCGAGPTHLYNSLKEIDFAGDIVSALPNAGYPEIINERTVYTHDPDYFADIMLKMKGLGIRILGGCCGTTPSHIRRLSERIAGGVVCHTASRQPEKHAYVPQDKVKNNFFEGMKKKKFMVAVELDPPFDAQIDKIMHGARVYKDKGVDILTIADSPMARVRVDSIMMGSRIKREVGIDTMPHLCCRDKNLNALKSALLAAHMEGIRNILAVTGDPIPNGSKGEVKSVFNLNSIELIELISEMNRELFADDSFNIGAALNPNVLNKEVEAARMLKKVERGASFFLTQPIFSDDAVDFLSRIEKPEDVRIFGGIMPIVSYRNARFLNSEIPGIKIPQAYIKRFSEGMSREEAEQTGINLAVEIARRIRKYVDGFYIITPFNRIEMVAAILDRIMDTESEA